ncbi:MAG: AgmX/PglI C-terminal domain-containing protein [Myxococcota bacterium]
MSEVRPAAEPASEEGSEEGRQKEAIQMVVRSNIGRIRSCYNAVLAKDPFAGGRVAAKFAIEESGVVSAAEVLHAERTAEATAPCIREAVMGMRFPSHDRGRALIITYPFVLVPDPAAGALEAPRLRAANEVERGHAERHVQTLRPHLDACFDGSSPPGRRIDVYLRVSGTGFIVQADLLSVDPQPPDVERCLQGILQSVDMKLDDKGFAFGVVVELYPEQPEP